MVQALVNFCSVDLGSLYLDVTKDRLYTMREDSRGRRSAQSAMYRIAEAFARWIAPILTFTADEMWAHLPGERTGHVLFATWYDGLAPMAQDAVLDGAKFDRLLALREQVAKTLEPMRASGEIGAALDAEIAIGVLCSSEECKDFEWLQPLEDELRFIFISGDVSVEKVLVPILQIGVDASSTVDAVYGSKFRVSAKASTKPKCVRCWHHRADVGAHAGHPELCGRCVSNVDGPGEDRRWF